MDSIQRVQIIATCGVLIMIAIFVASLFFNDEDREFLFFHGCIAQLTALLCILWVSYDG